MGRPSRDIVLRMRPITITLVLLLGCGKHEEAKPAAKTEEVPPAPPPVAKQMVSSAPLPGLAADPGGATGKPVWATGFGGLGIDSPRGIAVGPDGATYVAGYFDGTIDFGGAIGKLPSGGGSDAFVAKLGPDGKVTWAKVFGAKRDDVGNAIAIKGQRIAVVGNFLDELKIGDFDKKSNGSDDLFVLVLDLAGEPAWLWTAGGIDSDGANAIAATPDGGWVIGGSFSDTITIGTDSLKSKGRTDAILFKLDAGGVLQWVKQFGGRYNDSIRHVACDANGNVYVQGQFADVASWGGQPLVATGGAASDIVLAKYDTNGDHVWSQRFGNGLETSDAGGLAVDPAGHVTMVGSFDKTISFGDKSDQHVSLGEADAFVARFTTDGKLEWARSYGGERVDAASGVANDRSGNTVLSGWFQNGVDFGKGALASKGNKDVFVVKLDPKGDTVWAQSWGDHDHDQGRAVAIDEAGNAYVAGIYRFKLDLGTSSLDSARAEGDRIPKPDVFVVKLSR